MSRYRKAVVGYKLTRLARVDGLDLSDVIFSEGYICVILMCG